MKRTLTDIQNDITRTKGNIEAIQRHPFTEEDREILEPKYEAHLEKLKREEEAFKTEVIDPKTVTA